MCRTALGALNQWFKVGVYKSPQARSYRALTTEIWSDPRLQILGSKGLEAPTNTTGNAKFDYSSDLSDRPEKFVRVALSKCNYFS